MKNKVKRSNVGVFYFKNGKWNFYCKTNKRGLNLTLEAIRSLVRKPTAAFTYNVQELDRVV